MGKMKDRKEIIDYLVKNNPKSTIDKIIIYCDLFMDYQEAAENIRENGIVCAHPKTGAPFDNPYLKVRMQIQGALSKIRLKCDELWVDL
jgi:phage terminase small subunit